MEKIIKEKYKEPPFSLHDAHAVGLKIIDGNLEIIFDYGFIETKKPYNQKNGSVEITGVNWDMSHAYLLSYDGLCGNYGSFEGKKMPLREFCLTHQKVSVDIMDETFGFDSFKLTGFYTFDGDIKESILEISFKGDIIYYVDD